jgi:hypothetical protein
MQVRSPNLRRYCPLKEHRYSVSRLLLLALLTVALMSGACVQMQNQRNPSERHSSADTLIAYDASLFAVTRAKSG